MKNHHERPEKIFGRTLGLPGQRFKPRFGTKFPRSIPYGDRSLLIKAYICVFIQIMFFRGEICRWINYIVLCLRVEQKICCTIETIYDIIHMIKR